MLQLIEFAVMLPFVLLFAVVELTIKYRKYVGIVALVLVGVAIPQLALGLAITALVGKIGFSLC